MRITGGLICKNEERCIARCINSYKDIVDEIIVVDTGSTDRTVEIAEECGATVHYFEWIQDFAAARNYMLDRCTGDWIILLDADEWFLPGQAKILRDILQKAHGNRNFQAVILHMQNLDPSNKQLGQSEIGSIHQSIRVMRNLKKLRYAGRIHEMLLHDGKPLNSMRVEKDLIMLQHDGYRSDIIRSKGERNVESNKLSWEETKDPIYLHYAAMDLCNLGEDKEALAYFQHYFETGYFSAFFGTYPHKLAIGAMRRLKYPDEEIRQFIYDTAEKYPKNAGAQYFKAEYLREHERYAEAYVLYEKVDQLLGKKPQDQLDFGFTLAHTGYSSLFCHLADIDILKGDFERAQKHYERALDWDKSFPKAVQGMIWLLRKEGVDENFAYFRKRYNLDDIEDIKTLMEAYRIRKPGMEYLVLFEKYFAKEQKQDLFYFTMLMIVGEYKQAFSSFMMRSIVTGAPHYSMKALLAAYMGGGLNWLDGYEPEHVGQRIFDTRDLIAEGGPLTSELAGTYAMLVDDALRYIPPGDDRLAALIAPILPIAGSDKLPYLDMFQQSDHDELTRQLVESMAADTPNNILAQADRVRTMLEYKLGNFPAAKEAIVAARAHGLTSGLSDCYERWMEEGGR